MRWRNALTILVLLTVTSLPGFAQWRWGRPNRPQSGACFYRDTNFRGDYFCIREGERWDSLPSGYNDKISSINIYGGARLRLFNNRDFSGESVLIDTDVRDLRWIPLPGNIFKNWNDRVSSIAVFRDRDDWDRPPNRDRDEAHWRWGRPNRPQSGACFYRDTNFRGDYFCIDSGKFWVALPRDMNNQISSVNVYGGARVRVFREAEFGGRSRLVYQDIRNLKDWNDRISSIVVFGGWQRGYGDRRDSDYDRR